MIPKGKNLFPEGAKYCAGSGDKALAEGRNP
jgi:hypothetical protein